MTIFTGPLLASLDHASSSITILFGCLLVALILCLAFEEKIHAKKSLIAGMFAMVCLLLATALDILPYEPVVVGSHELVEHSAVDGEYQDDQQPVDFHADAVAADQPNHADPPVHVQGHEISMPVYIPAIDWGVIAIILGSSLFVDVTSKSGLFTWIAIKVTKRSRGDPLILLSFYGVMTVVFSAVLNNVTAMIIVGSLTAVSLERLHRKNLLLGFLLVEGLLTNIGGLLTLISSVPNIIVGTSAGISFMTFFVKAAPYVIVSTAVTIWMGARLFHINRLATDDEKNEAAELVAGFDENDGIQSWSFFWFGAIMLCLFIITIATTSVLPVVSDLQMGFVALAFACIMLLRFKSEVDNFYKAIDWDLIGFFMSLFVVIYVMEHAGVLGVIGTGIEAVLTDLKASPAHASDSAILLLGAAIFSSVTDNIPLAAMLANILSSLGTPTDSGLWWSIIFGANLGGNITPIGSASTLVAVTIIHKHKLHLTFGSFIKLAAPYAIVQIIMATIYVLIFLR